MTSFSDLLTITMNPVQVILTLIVGLLMGLYVWFIYKKTFSGVMYSRTYGMTLVMMTIVTALMLMLINNSLTLSLGWEPDELPITLYDLMIKAIQDRPVTHGEGMLHHEEGVLSLIHISEPTRH